MQKNMSELDGRALEKMDQEIAEQILRERNAEPGRLTPREVVEKLEQILEFGFVGPNLKRYEFQRLLEGKFTRHLTPKMLGMAWTQVGPSIMRERNWPDTKKGVVARCPRQVGKTWVIAHYIAGVALLQATTHTETRDHVTLVLSVTLTQANVVLRYVRTFLDQTVVTGWTVATDNVKTGIAIKGIGGLATIMAMPRPETVSFGGVCVLPPTGRYTKKSSRPRVT